MAGKALDAGKDFLADVLKRSKIPADLQATILADETLLESVGDGTLMRAEASRLADELNKEKARVADVARRQSEWHNSNDKGVLERTIEELRAKGGTNNPGGIDEKALDTRLTDLGNSMEALGVGLTSLMTTVGLSHMKEFGEVLDMTEVAQKAIAAKKPLKQYYDELVAPARKTRDDAARTKALDDAKAAGILEGRMQALNQKGPYPVGPGGPSTLDGLRKTPDPNAKPDYSLEAAVETATAELQKTA